MDEPDSHWFRKLGSPKYVVAPMVDQSEHSFRVLCRRHGLTLAYTPMFSSRQFVESETYRSSIFGELEGLEASEDRPLVVQFAGNDPQVLLAAAKHVQHRCDAVDVNLGCPQKIAKRGHYGAWLSDDWQLLKQIVGTLHCHLDCPVTTKIRLLHSADDVNCSNGKPPVDRYSLSRSVDYARMLVDAGSSLVAVHGRTREQRGELQGGADWAPIATIKAALSVPVLANGSMRTLSDIDACLATSHADGVLLGEALLENPAVVEGRTVGGGAPTQEDLALEYLELQALYPADLRGVKQHLFSICYGGLQVHTELRTRMHRARTLEQMREIVVALSEAPRISRPPFCNELNERRTRSPHPNPAPCLQLLARPCVYIYTSA